MVEISKTNEVQSKIYTIRGLQVMLDSDLAELYGVETRILNQAVKRNIERFPNRFYFQLNITEFTEWRSQIVMSNNVKMGMRWKPYAFTEQGIAMLAGVLKSKIAVKVSIQIIDTFVKMRRFLNSNSNVYQRIDLLEFKQIETDKKVDKVLNAMESKELQPKQKIFYNGQVFDAHIFLSDLFKKAKKSITIIDNYIDKTVLVHLGEKNKSVKVIIYTKQVTLQLKLNENKFNEQYGNLTIKEFKDSHDRFIIIDDEEIYHFGASLKDLGKKWFAFSKMDIGAVEMLGKLKEHQECRGRRNASRKG